MCHLIYFAYLIILCLVPERLCSRLSCFILMTILRCIPILYMKKLRHRGAKSLPWGYWTEGYLRRPKGLPFLSLSCTQTYHSTLVQTAELCEKHHALKSKFCYLLGGGGCWWWKHYISLWCYRLWCDTWTTFGGLHSMKLKHFFLFLAVIAF